MRKPREQTQSTSQVALTRKETTRNPSVARKLFAGNRAARLYISSVGSNARADHARDRRVNGVIFAEVQLDKHVALPRTESEPGHSREETRKL